MMTFGAEFELSDWDRRRPCGWDLDLRDHTMVNSCGIAVDPTARLYWQGGEVRAHPSETPSSVYNQLAEFIEEYPEASVNYRSNLHVHVGVPGLRDDLDKLKRVQRFCNEWLPALLPVMEPIPEPTRKEYPLEEEYRGARRRRARRRVSHQHVMSLSTVERQMLARTPQEFFEAEALHAPTGRLHWAIHPRCAVNLRQLLQTDTVEFRHFPGTIEPREVLSAVCWCRDFTEMALEVDGDPVRHWYADYYNGPWPSFEPYVHWMEERFLLTSARHAGVGMARENIARILRNE